MGIAIKRNTTVREVTNLTSFIQAEGGLLCGTVLFQVLYRLHKRAGLRRTERGTKADLNGHKDTAAILYVIKMALYLANFGLCIGGRSLYRERDWVDGRVQDRTKCIFFIHIYKQPKSPFNCRRRQYLNSTW